MTDADIDATLAPYRRWLLKVATVYLPRQPHEWQDLAQEGWIAMWRALASYDPNKGALASWLTTAARLRMLTCVKRSLWLGTPSRRGHVRELPAPPVDTDWEWIQELSPVVLELELAYHRGEIAEAIDRLPPRAREAVIRRFWFGDPVPTGNWVTAKRFLAKELAHLQEVS